MKSMRLALLTVALFLLASTFAAAVTTYETDIFYLSGGRWVKGTRGLIASFVSASTTLATAAIGGGYGSTGVSVSATGNIQANGTLTVDGISTLTGAVTGGAGITATGALTGATGVFGGGYGSTGLSIAATGNLSTNGTLTVDGASTLAGVTSSGTISADDIAVTNDVTAGGDVAATGDITAATITTTGAGTFTGAVTGSSTGTFAGALNANGGLTLDSTKLTVADTTGVLHSIPTFTTGYGWLLDASTGTTGDAFEIFADTDTAVELGILNITAGANYAGKASVFKVDEDGDVTAAGDVAADSATFTKANTQLTIKYGADDYTTFAQADDGTLTINTTSNATANTVFSDPAAFSSTLNSVGAFTVNTNKLAVAADTGIVTMANGTTINNNAAADTVTITETNIGLAGATTVTGAGVVNGDFSVTDTTGAQITAKYDAGDYTTITQANTGGVTLDCTSEGTASFTFSDPVYSTAAMVTNTDATETLTAAQSGAVVVCTAAGGTTTITLPDPGAGTVGVTYTIVQTADQNVDIVPTTANGNSIVADNVATSDKASLATASHKIGAVAKVFGISATKWLITAVSPTCPLTVEAAD